MNGAASPIRQNLNRAKGRGEKDKAGNADPDERGDA
jgi:hypothetical protein